MKIKPTTNSDPTRNYKPDSVGSILPRTKVASVIEVRAIAGMMKTTGIIFWPNKPIAIIFDTNANISIDKNTKYIGVARKPIGFL